MFSRLFRTFGFQYQSQRFFSVGSEEDFLLLSNFQNFTADNYSNMIKKLFFIYRNEFKEKFPDDLKKELTKRGVFNSFGLVVEKFSHDQIAELARNLGNLRANDNFLWGKIETQVIKKLYKTMTPNNIVAVLDGSMKCKWTSKVLYEAIEDYILNNFYPNNQFTAEQVSTILFSFHLSGRGSNVLYSRLTENMINVVENFNARQLHRAFAYFAAQEQPNAEAIIALSTQALRLKCDFSGVKLEKLLSNLIKVGADEEVISEIEVEVLQKIGTLGLSDFSRISQNYAKQYGSVITENNQKRKLLKEIEKFYSEHRKELIVGYIGGNVEVVISRLMWGLAKGNIMENLPLWKSFKFDLEKNPKYKELLDTRMGKDILDVLERNHIR